MTEELVNIFVILAAGEEALQVGGPLAVNDIKLVDVPDMSSASERKTRKTLFWDSFRSAATRVRLLTSDQVFAAELGGSAGICRPIVTTTVFPASDGERSAFVAQLSSSCESNMLRQSGDSVSFS